MSIFISGRQFFRGINSKFLFLKRSFDRNHFKLLDIGSGNHSASKTVSLFPNCEYYGVDFRRDYNNSEADYAVMKNFYEMDLALLEFDSIPGNFFDGIWMVHVIEHLQEGDKVIEGLLSKLKPGGYMYVEYPGEKSTRLPSMKGTLNFYDDASHVRIYTVSELEKLFRKYNFNILKSGTRRNWYFILAAPLRILGHWLGGKRLIGNIFWDLAGFAEFLYVRKN
jgi:SAM-dependent methyltransferase